MIVTKSNRKFDKIKLSFDKKYGKFCAQSLENLQHRLLHWIIGMLMTWLAAKILNPSSD